MVLLVAVLISCDQKKARTALTSNQIATIENLMATARIPGLQLGYFNAESESVYAGGYSSLSDSSIVKEATLFRANDLGYCVISALCFRLAEENQLDLNQAISQDYQDTRLESGSYNHIITYKNLLSHTGGLPIWADENESIKIISVPGETWNYSHLGFEWVMRGLEAKFNTPIQELTNRWVFQPLEITDSFFGNEEKKDMAKGHDLIGRIKSAGVTNTTTFYTNAGEYLKILSAFAEGYFQNESMEAQSTTLAQVNMWEDETTTPLVSWGPGLGIQAGENIGLWQYSDEQTMKSFAIVYPETKTGFVILTNSENGLAIGQAISDLFYNEQIAALDWLAFETFDDPSWQVRRTLESAFSFGDSLFARNTYKEIFNDDYNELDNNLLNNVIWSFFEKNELASAERLARLHIEHFPNTANTYIRLGETLGFQSKYESSWQNYQKAMELDPESSRQIMPRFPWYMEATSVSEESQELPLSLFSGSFENSTVEVRNNQLVFSDDQYNKIVLKRIGNTLFDLEIAETFRINFVVTNGQIESLEKSYLNGERTVESKKSI